VLHFGIVEEREEPLLVLLVLFFQLSDLLCERIDLRLLLALVPYHLPFPSLLLLIKSDARVVRVIYLQLLQSKLGALLSVEPPKSIPAVPILRGTPFFGDLPQEDVDSMGSHLHLVLEPLSFPTRRSELLPRIVLRRKLLL